jgi:PAS domain S-box-containing protein
LYSGKSIEPEFSIPQPTRIFSFGFISKKFGGPMVPCYNTWRGFKMMNPHRKTKRQLIQELEDLQQRLTILQKSKTTRRPMEQEQRNSDERFRQLVENAPDPIFIQTQKQFVYINKAAVRMFGGKVPAQFLGRPVMDRIHPDYQAIILKRIRSLNVGKKAVPLLEQKFLKLDGTSFDVEVSAVTCRYGSRRGALVFSRDITARKKTETALRLSEEKLSKAFKASPNWISISTWDEGRYLDVNDTFLQISGYRREEVVGFSSIEIQLWENPEDRQRALEIIRQDGRLKDFEVNFRIKPGEIRTFLWSAELIEIEGKKCILSACQDITRRKEMEKALRLSEEKYQLLVNNASMGIMVSQDFKIMFANPKAAEISGYSQEELYLKPLLELVHPDYHAFSKDRIIRRLRGEPLSTSTLIKGLKKNGQAHWLDMGVVSNLWEGKPAFLYFYQDITEIKAAREELLKNKNELEWRVKERTTVLQKLNKKLEKELIERKGIEEALKKSEKDLRFLSNQLINAQENERKRIAYELHDDLGQSLVGLKFQLSGLKQKATQTRNHPTQDITKALDTIDKITADVRQISRELRPAVLEHLGLVEALQWLFEDFYGKYGIKVFHSIKKINFKFSKEQEIIIFRIFQEGLANVGKHSGATQVTITMTQDAKASTFSIKDNGKGFDLKRMETRNPLKAGLGLTAMKERALMAGGSIEIKSEIGQGTSLTFSAQGRRPLKRPAQGFD